MQDTVFTTPQQYGPDAETTSDARVHAAHIRQMLSQVVTHARQDQDRVNDPMARALFETTAEALLGLIKAFEDYERDLPEWQK